MNKIRWSTIAGILVLVLLIMTNGSSALGKSGTAVKPIDLSNFDTSVKPSEDFYRYVNGTWLKNNPVPPELSRYSSMDELREHNFAALHEILDKAAAAKRAGKGSTLQLVGDFYASGMDSAAIEAAGMKPLQSDLDRVAAMKSTADLEKMVGSLHMLEMNVLFAFGSSVDDKNSSQMIAQFYQGGLGLPDRDYYTKDDEQSKQLREKYVAHVKKMFTLIGDDEATAEKNAKTVLDFETRLAKASMTRVEQRNPEAVYHKMTINELETTAPDFKWKEYFVAVGLPKLASLNVSQPKFATEISSMVKSVPLDDWKTYLRWHIVLNGASILSNDFVNENFDFYGKMLNGTKELRPRWKRSMLLIDGNIGDALGQLYVEKYFPPNAKKRARELVENLRETLRNRINNLDWMSDATKQQALKKLNAFGVKIGYPDKWKDYTGLKITRNSYYQNIMNASVYDFKKQLKKVGKPVDKTEWEMTPPTVNAYYHPTRNEIVFPAGILQPPYFYADADDAVNYGGIGCIIGHEMSHGFDDQGRQYDAKGNLKDWWTEDDAKKYNERASVVEKQFDNYIPIDTLHINGKFTLGENLGDLGGITLGYYALQMALEKSGRPEKIDGFTPEQRFFVSWAQVWRGNIRPENLKLRLMTDPHSPGEYRCIGPLSNMTEFMQAFDIPEGSPMIRATNERVKVW
jgi:putative endopeptidase